MKIIYVADGGETHDLARFYQTHRRILNGLIRNGHNAVLFSLKFMRKHLGLLPARAFGHRAAARTLQRFAANFRPDLLLLHHAHSIEPALLLALRRMLPALKIAQIGLDPLFIADNIGRLEHKLAALDATFVTTGGPILRRFAGQGRVAAFIPNPVDPSIDIHRSFEHADLPTDLFLATSGTSSDAERRAIPEAVKTRLPDLAFEYYSGVAGRTLWGSAFIDALGRSKMGLNLSRIREGSQDSPPETLHLYSSSRLGQYVGNGLLIFDRRGYSLEELFRPDEEAVFFGEAEELIEKLDYYRRHDAARRAVAGRGWRRAHENYSERQVAQFIVDVTTGAPFSMPYGWDTTLWR